jgi:CubicO group peptidase (beta-lactamase class C family)
MIDTLRIRETDPRTAMMDPDRLQGAARLLDEGLHDELYPGGVLWVSRGGVSALLHCVGHTGYSRTTPVDEHTLFDMASLTKPVAMASSMLLCLQDGLVHLGQNVADFFPERSLPHLGDVTLHHLLTHTSGLPPWKDMYSKGQARDELVDELFAIPLDHEPGDFYAYSCLGYIMLSLVLERVAGQRVDEFARVRVFEPIGMQNTMYNPPVDDGRVIAATDHCPLRKRILVGEVHDGNAYAMGGVSGNAGLFSTAEDLARFCHSITRESSSWPESPFSPPVVRRMFANAIPERIGGQTIGWFVFPNDMLPAGDLVSRNAIGHSGFTGTAVVIDPDYDLCVVLLTNRVCREGDGVAFSHLRRRILNAVLGSIVG